MEVSYLGGLNSSPTVPLTSSISDRLCCASKKGKELRRPRTRRSSKPCSGSRPATPRWEHPIRRFEGSMIRLVQPAEFYRSVPWILSDVLITGRIRSMPIRMPVPARLTRFLWVRSCLSAVGRPASHSHLAIGGRRAWNVKKESVIENVRKGARPVCSGQRGFDHHEGGGPFQELR